MDRKALEHLIRAAAAITDQYEIVVIGSQSILGAVPNAASEFLLSMEADLYPLHRPELSDLIDGSIGELSAFESCFGYYAQGVGVNTAILPSGWETRLVKIQNSNTDMKIGLCLEPHDMAASKLVAGRDKDLPFVEAMIRHNIIKPELLLTRIDALPIAPEQKNDLSQWIHRKLKESDSKPSVTRDTLG